MISLSGAVSVMLYLVLGALVFGLLWFLISFVGKLLGGEPAGLFVRIGQAILVILAVLVLIGLLLSLVGGQPLFRP